MNKNPLSNVKTLSLALSGGGHRATVFAFGALLYLIHSTRNQDVRLITSVSGGSITNAWLSLLPKSFSQLKSNSEKHKFETDLAEFSKQIAGRPGWWTFTVCIYFLSYFVIWIVPEYLEMPNWSWNNRVVVFVACFCILAWIVGPLSQGTLWGSRIWWTYVGLVTFGIIAGVAAVVNFYVLGGALLLLTTAIGYSYAPHVVAYVFGTMISVQSHQAGTQTNALVFLQRKNRANNEKHNNLDSPEIRHIFCATQLQVKRHFYMSEEFVFSHYFGVGKPRELRVCDAVQASANFPFAFPARVFRPEAFDMSTVYRGSQEIANKDLFLPGEKLVDLALIDGGVFDNTGFSWFRESTEILEKLDLQSSEIGISQDRLMSQIRSLLWVRKMYEEKLPYQLPLLLMNIKYTLEALSLHDAVVLGNQSIRDEFDYLQTKFRYLYRDSKEILKKWNSQESIPEPLQTRTLYLATELTQFINCLLSIQDTDKSQEHYVKALELATMSHEENTEVIIINCSDPFRLNPIATRCPLALIWNLMKPASVMYDIPYAQHLLTLTKDFLKQLSYKGGIVSISDSPVDLPHYVIDIYHRFSDPPEMSQLISQDQSRETRLQELAVRNRFPVSGKPTKAQYFRALEVCYQGEHKLMADVQISEDDRQAITVALDNIAEHKQKHRKELARLETRLNEWKALARQHLPENDMYKIRPFSDEELKLLPENQDIENVGGDLLKLIEVFKNIMKEIKSRREAAENKMFGLTLDATWGWLGAANVSTTLKPLGLNNTACILHQGYYSAMFTLYTLCDGYVLFRNGPKLKDFRSFVKAGQPLPKGEKYISKIDLP